MVFEVKGEIYKSGTVGKGKLAGMKYYRLLVQRHDGMKDDFTLFSNNDYKVGQEIKVLVDSFIRSAVEVQSQFRGVK